MEAPVSEPPRNPYIGPSAFSAGERLYGRDRELNQLTNLIVAERIVLLHSPSGAGKTSLIQAALIPRLTSMRFRVLPVVRVHLELPDGKADGNRYVLSTLLYLNAGLPESEQIPTEQLARMTMAEYLSCLKEREKKPGIEVLIFDQFEEILTLDPTDLAAKQEFFRQLGEAVDAPNRWILFSMRDDYVAALSSYEVWIPSQIHNRFRLDLLNREAARQAIERPAADRGVRFEEGIADKLVDDLRRVRVQRSDGSLEMQLGEFVEPVQLQVVCYRLWENAHPESGMITSQDMTALEAVDQSLVDHSLGAYYDERVRATADKTGTSERAIREWFDRKLITEQGVRGSVLMGEESSGGLDNQAVHMLENAYLVRAEKRSGITWYELAHDRLIAPIRAENAAWFRANLNLLQQQADLWNQQGRPESLLISGPELDQARGWARQEGTVLLPYEQDFLEACEKQEARARALRRRNRTILILGVLAFLFAIFSWLAYRQAEIQREKAQEQARVALANQLAAQAQTELQENPLRSLLLSVEAVNATVKAGQPRQSSAEEALRAALRDSHGQLLPGHNGAVTALAFSPDGRWLATGSDDTIVRLWKVGQEIADPILLKGHSQAIIGLAFSPDGSRVVSASKDLTIRLWNLSGGNPAADPVILSGPRQEIISLAVSPDGKWLAAASLEQMAWLWKLDESGPSSVPLALPLTGDGWAMAFSPDGRFLASSDAENVRLWDLRVTNPAGSTWLLRGHQGLVTSLAFSPNSHWIASGSRDHTARLWDVQAGNPTGSSLVLTGHEDWVNTVAFSPDGQHLATGGGDATVRLWDLAALANPQAELAVPGELAVPAPLVLRGHTRWVSVLAFSPDRRWLVSGSGDHALRLWDLRAADPAANPLTLRGHDGPITSVAFQPHGGLLASGSEDQTARLWDLQTQDPLANPLVLRDPDRPLSATIFSPNGKWLAAGGGDPARGDVPNQVLLWPVQERGRLGSVVHLGGLRGWVSALTFQPGGRWLAAGGGSDTIKLWDLERQNFEAPLILTGHTGWVWSLAFSPDGRRLASGSEDGTARVWDLQAADPSAQPLVLRLGERVGVVAFSPDGRWLATASGLNVRLWDLQAADTAASSVDLSGHEDTVLALAFSPDGKWLASGSRDSSVRLWNLHSEPVRSILLNGHNDWVNALAFSPDSSRLATVSSDRTARLWNLRMDDPSASVVVLSGHNAAIKVVAFSADGMWLATGSDDGTARLWSLSNNDPSGSSVALRNHTAAVTALAFSPDGNWLATGSQDQTVQLWITQLDVLVDNACQVAGRNLTREEWQRYFPAQPYAVTCNIWPAP